VEIAVFKDEKKTHFEKLAFKELRSANEISLLELNAPLYFHDWLLIKKELDRITLYRR